jgi:hypothetical protein
MTMTKADYELVARIVKSLRDVNPECDSIADSITYRFIGAFAHTYPNFKADIFKTACGTE